jgi:MFS family permease
MEVVSAKRNAKLVNVATFCAELSFETPIWLLFSIGYLGMSASLAALLYTGMWFIGSLFEIPTGAIADRMGRKKAYIMGMSLMSVFPLTFALNPPLPLFIILVIIAGFGSSLASGALIPLVHASFERAKLGKRQYHAFLSTNRATLFAARIPSALIGAWLYTIWAPAPFIAWFVAMVIAACVVWFVRETRDTSIVSTYRGHIKEAMQALFVRRIIIVLIAGYVIANVYAEGIWTAYQILYESDGIDIMTIGLLLSVVAAISAISAYFVKHTFTRVQPMMLLFVGACLMSTTAFLLYQPIAEMRIVAIAPMAIASGFMALTVSAAIQGVVPNRLQSTALSIFSFAIYTAYTVGSFSVGKVLDVWGTDGARLYLLVVAVVGLACVAALTFASRRSLYRLEMAEE